MVVASALVRGSSRYLRADTLPHETCPTCGDQLLTLRWGHEDRCAAFARRRRALRTVVGLVLLGLVYAFLLPGPAQGQTQPRYLDASSAVVTLQDGGVVRVDGGAWLSDAVIDDTFAERLKLKTTVDNLEAHAGDVELKKLVEVGSGGFLIGGSTGITVKALVLPATPPK